MNLGYTEGVEAPLTYTVLVADAAHWKPAEIARVLAAYKRVPAADIAVSLRRAWGIVAQGLEPAEAERQAAALLAGGFCALSVPDSLVEEPPVAALAPALELARVQDGLVLVAAGEWREVTRSEVTVQEGPTLGQKALRVGLFAVGIPLPGPGARSVKKTVESADLACVLDLIYEKPARRLRVDARSFDFSCLGARKAYDAGTNFRRLAAELAALAGDGRINRGARILRDGRPTREMGYEALADLEREERWLLALRALKPR